MDGIIYARISTPEQKHGTSLDSQVDECHVLADSMGCDIDPHHVIRDQGSGSDPTRPGMANLKAILDMGACKHLFVFSPDRIARVPADLLIFRDYLDELDVAWHFVHGPQGDSPETRIVAYLFGYSGQRERMATIERTRRGKREVALRGRLPIGTGAGLFGYDYDAKTKTRRINGEEAEAVRMMYRQYAEGRTKHAIAVEMNRLGIRTKRGVAWHPNSVKRVLTNPAYRGETWYGKARHRLVAGGKIERIPLPESEWVLVPGFTPPIVSESLYQQVQERQSMLKEHNPKKVFDYLLTGFLECAVCGSRVSGAGKRGKGTTYRCRATQATAVSPATCSASYIPAQPLETVVWEQVLDLISHPALIAQSVSQRWETEGQKLDLAIKTLGLEISKSRKREGVLVRWYAEGRLDDEALADQMRPIKRQRRELEAKREELFRQQAAYREKRLMDERLRDYCRRIREGLNMETFEGKVATLNAVGAKAVVSLEELTLHITLPEEMLPTFDPEKLTSTFSKALRAHASRIA